MEAVGLVCIAAAARVIATTGGVERRSSYTFAIVSETLRHSF